MCAASGTRRGVELSWPTPPSVLSLPFLLFDLGPQYLLLSGLSCTSDITPPHLSPECLHCAISLPACDRSMTGASQSQYRKHCGLDTMVPDSGWRLVLMFPAGMAAAGWKASFLTVPGPAKILLCSCPGLAPTTSSAVLSRNLHLR